MSKPGSDFAYELNKTMEDHSIRLSYTGEFTSDLISVLLGMSKGSIKMGTVQKKVYNLMIESLENVVNHAPKMMDSPYPAIFILAQDESNNYVCTGNKIHNDQIPELEAKLKKANSLNREDLRAWYNEVMINGELPNDNRGAGLGIIDMALRSSEKLHYEFLPIDENSSFYVLKMVVNA